LPDAGIVKVTEGPSVARSVYEAEVVVSEVTTSAVPQTTAASSGMTVMRRFVKVAVPVLDAY
jgi:hypothetical protein